MSVFKRLAFWGLGLAAVVGSGIGLGQDRYLGEIILVGYNFCPRGTVEAAGQLLAIAQNDALFSLYGTTYGGDGRTTFALPDLRGRVALGVGQGPGLASYREGQKGGAETVTLTQSQLPSHSHTATTDLSGVRATLRAAEDVPDTSSAAGASLSEARIYVNGAGATPSASLNPGSVALTGEAVTTVGNAGGNQSFPVQQPYLTLRYCVVLSGLYPSRN